MNTRKLDFIRLLEAAGVPNAQAEADVFMRDNPIIETDFTPQEAALEWISAAADAADWQDPARYGR